MRPLVREALEINRELEGVVFVGAIARYFHTRVLRESEDIDFAITRPITEEALDARGYKTRNEGRKRVTRTPRGVKVDIYRDDVSGIPVNTILETSVEIR